MLCTVQEAQAKSNEDIKNLLPSDLVDAHFLTHADVEDKLMGPKLKMMCVLRDAQCLFLHAWLTQGCIEEQGCACRWDYFMPVYNGCPAKEKLGVVPRLGDNGKWTCGVQSLLQREGCVVYSFGSNGDTSFEEDVLRKTVCEVHTFDPTLDAEQEAQVLAVPGINLHKIGLAAEPGEVRLHGMLGMPGHGAVLIVCMHLARVQPLQMHACLPQMEVEDVMRTMRRNITKFPVESLGNLMAEIGHDWIDVLKVDILCWSALPCSVCGIGTLPCSCQHHHHGLF